MCWMVLQIMSLSQAQLTRYFVEANFLTSFTNVCRHNIDYTGCPGSSQLNNYTNNKMRTFNIKPTMSSFRMRPIKNNDKSKKKSILACLPISPERNIHVTTNSLDDACDYPVCIVLSVTVHIRVFQGDSGGLALNTDTLQGMVGFFDLYDKQAGRLDDSIHQINEDIERVDKEIDAIQKELTELNIGKDPKEYK